LLEHADAHDPVERAVGRELAIVLHADRDARLEPARPEHLVGAAERNMSALPRRSLHAWPPVALT
jgi:hypothetical protein